MPHRSHRRPTAQAKNKEPLSASVDADLAARVRAYGGGFLSLSFAVSDLLEAGLKVRGPRFKPEPK